MTGTGPSASQQTTEGTASSSSSSSAAAAMAATGARTGTEATTTATESVHSTAPSSPFSTHAVTAAAAAAAGSPAAVTAQTYTPPLAQPQPTPTLQPSQPQPQQKDGSTLIECIICGKPFPRGMVDLQRHEQAPTLQHLATKKRTKTHTIPCERHGPLPVKGGFKGKHKGSPKAVHAHNSTTTTSANDASATQCDYWFMSQEHLDSHMLHSRCNPHRVPFSSGTNSPKSAASAASIARNKNDVTATGDEKPVKLTKGQAIAAGKARAAAAKAERELAIANGEISPDEAVHRPGADSPDLTLPRSKRAKVLLPDDRKAYFSIASLLVDQSKVPMGMTLDAENFEKYVSNEKRAVLRKLEETLLYTC